MPNESTINQVANTVAWRWVAVPRHSTTSDNDVPQLTDQLTGGLINETKKG